MFDHIKKRGLKGNIYCGVDEILAN